MVAHQLELAAHEVGITHGACQGERSLDPENVFRRNANIEPVAR